MLHMMIWYHQNHIIKTNNFINFKIEYTIRILRYNFIVLLNCFKVNSNWYDPLAMVRNFAAFLILIRTDRHFAPTYFKLLPGLNSGSDFLLLAKFLNVEPCLTFMPCVTWLNLTNLTCHLIMWHLTCDTWHVTLALT